MPTNVPALTTKILAGGAIGFGILGLASPARLGRMLGSHEQTAREVGFRDVGNGLVILAAPTAGLAQRVFFDVSDALMFGRRKPKVGIGALAFAALGVYTLAAR